MQNEKCYYSVLIVSGLSEREELLSDLLPVKEFSPVISVSNAAEAKRLMISRIFDIVIINTPLQDEFGNDFALEIAQSKYVGVILIVKADMFDEVACQVEQQGVFTLAKPNLKQMIYQAIKLLVAVREKIKRMEEKNVSLQTKMESIRIINHAKWILIEKQKMNEETAHRYIERQAMEKRLSKKEVAQNIIKMYKKN